MATENPLLEPWKKAIGNVLQTDELKVTMLAITLSAGAELACYIIKMSDFVDVPVDIRYKLAQMINAFESIRAHSTGEKPRDIPVKKLPYIADFNDKEIEARLVHVVQYMYDNLKERGLIK